jgi:Raf kinase inhibitor-like YbhB/YbcL family protein
MKGVIMALIISSPAFPENGEVPAQYTCDGADVSPPLVWSGVPPEAKSLVLILDDPDAPDPAAPRTVWAHWLLYNIPPSTTGLPEDVANNGGLPAGTRVGANDWRQAAYGGPCPPIGQHRYFHKLYALDTILPDLNSPTKGELEAAIQGHVIDQAELVVPYSHK